MMNVLCSMICFVLFLLLGDVLMFINTRFFCFTSLVSYLPLSFKRCLQNSKL